MGGQTLQGAVFTADLNATGVASSLTSGSDGFLSNGSATVFELGIRSAPYILTETAAPSGYLPLTGNVLVSVSDNSQNPVTARLEGTTTTFTVTGPDVNDVYTVQITNSNGISLPSTGGRGRSIFTLGGIVLMAAAAIMLGFRMRRRERRYK